MDHERHLHFQHMAQQPRQQTVLAIGFRAFSGEAPASSTSAMALELAASAPLDFTIQYPPRREVVRRVTGGPLLHSSLLLQPPHPSPKREIFFSF